MTNQEVIRLIRNLPTLCEFTDAYGEPIDSDAYYEAVEMAISALEAQEAKTQLSSEGSTSDCISRQAAIEALCSDCQGRCVPCDSYPCSEVEVINALPSAQPVPNLDEWCTDCKEYDHERHCCPRFNRVIRQTFKDIQLIRCKDCKHYVKDHGWNCIEYMVCSISPLHRMLRNPDDYCSRAERRTE